MNLSPSLVSIVFATAVAASTGVRGWLATRQMRHVAAHRDTVPPEHAAAISLEEHRKAADYTVARGRFSLVATGVGAVALLAWTLLGGLDVLNAAIRDAVGGRWRGIPYELALFGAFSLIGWLVDLPLELHRTFRLEQRFGFNKMTPGLFIADTLKGAAVGVIIGAPLLSLVLWIMQSSGGLWWLWAWCAWVAIVLLAQVVYPLWIAPIFNQFKPLEDAALRERIGALMTRSGFRLSGMFEMDGSKRSAHSNAYFTGIGAAKRVVFYDTLLKQLDADEMEAVLAHELGHFKHRHVLKNTILMLGLGLAGFALLGWLAQQPGFYLGLGVTPNNDAPNAALALLLFMMALPPVMFFVSPLFAAMSRRAEFQADAYARAQASAAHLVRALLKITRDNAGTLTPDPVYVRFYYTHPPLGARIAALEAAS